MHVNTYSARLEVSMYLVDLSPNILSCLLCLPLGYSDKSLCSSSLLSCLLGNPLACCIVRPQENDLMRLPHNVSQLSLEDVFRHMSAEFPLMVFPWDVIRNRLLIVTDLTKEFATS